MKKWQLGGFVFTAIAGVILHFLYDWTGGSVLVAPISAINESIFEHMKLLFFPMFIFALIQNRYIGKDYKNFWCVKLLGISLGVILIPMLYYTINGAFGEMPDWVNIAIFFVTSAITYLIESWLFKNCCIKCKSQNKALLILWIMAGIFALLTFIPPRVPLFQDPITKKYGI